MLKTTSNGTQATTAIKFSLRPTAETLADLSRPIDPRHLKTRKQGTATLTYCPWNTIARHLHHRAPGWCWEVQSVQAVGNAVVVTGRLTIPTADVLPVDEGIARSHQGLVDVCAPLEDFGNASAITISCFDL